MATSFFFRSSDTISVRDYDYINEQLYSHNKIISSIIMPSMFCSYVKFFIPLSSSVAPWVLVILWEVC